MTPPTEFNPTPEQVEEVGRMLSGRTKEFWDKWCPQEKSPWFRAGTKHLTELHRELSTLRAQVEALKGQVVVARIALQAADLEIQSYHIDWERMGSEKNYLPEFPPIHSQIQQALAQLSPK